MIIRFKKIKKRTLFYYLINLVSAVLLMSETTSIVKPFLLVLCSILMIPNPLSYIPMLFVSSWSISFTALPGLAAFFYYLVLFFISVFISLLINKEKVVSFVSSFPAARYSLLFAIWIFATAFSSVICPEEIGEKLQSARPISQIDSLIIGITTPTARPR